MTKLRAYRENGGKIYNLLEHQAKKKQKAERIEKQNEWARKAKKEADRYAEVFTRLIPGIEKRQMYWLRDLSKHENRIG